MLGAVGVIVLGILLVLGISYLVTEDGKKNAQIKKIERVNRELANELTQFENRVTNISLTDAENALDIIKNWAQEIEQKRLSGD